MDEGLRTFLGKEGITGLVSEDGEQKPKVEVKTGLDHGNRGVILSTVDTIANGSRIIDVPLKWCITYDVPRTSNAGLLSQPEVFEAVKRWQHFENWQKLYQLSIFKEHPNHAQHCLTLNLLLLYHLYGWQMEEAKEGGRLVDFKPDDPLHIHGYLFALPTRSQVDCPIVWTEGQQEHLSEGLTSAVLEDKELHSQLIRTIALEIDIGLLEFLLWEDWSWCKSMVMSRGMQFFTANQELATVALVPGVDMINTRIAVGDIPPEQHFNVTHCYIPEEEMVSIVAISEIEPGAQLFLDYGVKSNATLLYMYGFIFPGNPLESIVEMSLYAEISDNDPLAVQKRRLLDETYAAELCPQRACNMEAISLTTGQNMLPAPIVVSVRIALFRGPTGDAFLDSEMLTQHADDLLTLLKAQMQSKLWVEMEPHVRMHFVDKLAKCNGGNRDGITNMGKITKIHDMVMNRCSEDVNKRRRVLAMAESRSALRIYQRHMGNLKALGEMLRAQTLS
eukprot:Clim_evm3s153 gene=Clim_evmTU3s153